MVMLVISSIQLLIFVLLVLSYGFFMRGISLKTPQLKKEEVQTASLFSKFEALYPKEEKGEKPPSITLLATATGSVRLALAQVNGSPQTLRIGTQVGGYKVVSIERNYVVLSKDKNRLAVGFNLRTEVPQQQASAVQPSASSPQASKSLQANLSREELQRITADPGIMFRQIRLVPFVQEGRTRGFLFEWIEPGSIFERAGIKPGDVLLSINNQEIKSGEDAFRILQVLRNENSIKLNLQRGSEIIELLLRVEG